MVLLFVGVGWFGVVDVSGLRVLLGNGAVFPGFCNGCVSGAILSGFVPCLRAFQAVQSSSKQRGARSGAVRTTRPPCPERVAAVTRAAPAATRLSFGAGHFTKPGGLDTNVGTQLRRIQERAGVAVGYSGSSRTVHATDRGSVSPFGSTGGGAGGRVRQTDPGRFGDTRDRS